MGGILGALIGRHMAHKEEQRQRTFKNIGDAITTYTADPIHSQHTPEQIDGLMKVAAKMKMFEPEYGSYLQDMVDRAHIQRQAADKLNQMTAATNNGAVASNTQRLLGGVPADVAAASGAPAPVAAGPAPAPVAPAAPPQGSPDALRALLTGGTPAAAPAPPANPLGMLLNNVPGLPTPPRPFDGGGTAGAPPNAPIPAPIAQAANAGQQGFSSAPTIAAQMPAPAPPAPAPAPTPAPPVPTPAPAPMTPPPQQNIPDMSGPPSSQILTPQEQFALSQPPPFWHAGRTPEEMGRIKAREAAPVIESANALALAQDKARLLAESEIRRGQMPLDIEARRKQYEGMEGWDELTPRQKFIVLSGQNITPEPFRMLQGTYEADGVNDVDEYGNLVPKGTLGKKVSFNGQMVFNPEVGATHVLLTPDAKSSTGWSQLTLNRKNEEVGRHEAPPPPAFAPTTHTNTRTGQQTRVIGNQVVQFPTTATTSSTSQRTFPGVPAPPDGAAPAAGVTPATPITRTTRPTRTPAATGPDQTPSGGPALPHGSRVLGESPAAWKARIENQYTPNGQKVLAQLEPRMKMVQAIKTELEKFKNDDTPATSLIPTIMYRLGFSGSQGAFLSQLNLSDLGQAASVLQGVTKGKEMMGKALIHTADSWKDSRKLMYEKTSEILRNMNDIKAAVDKYERKYPGLNAQPGGPSNIPAPPRGDPLGIR